MLLISRLVCLCLRGSAFWVLVGFGGWFGDGGAADFAGWCFCVSGFAWRVT